MTTVDRLNILDVPVDAIDMPGALRFAEQLIRHPVRRGYVLAVNPEKVFALKRDPDLLGIFRDAALLLPDGIGIVWAAGFLCGCRIRRTTGADFMQDLCVLAVRMGFSVFIYGSTEETNRKATEILLRRLPGLKVAGRCNGYVPEAGIPDLIRKINASGAEILFVGLGSPRQEHFIRNNFPDLQVKLCQGIGGTLDTIAGNVKRAPEWCRRINLEWLYRLIRQPRRLKRQLVLPRFLWRILLEKHRRTVGRDEMN
ncbi:WecB/TagA/CpsF family glycosyltransferase [bacterium]|nr:WecB/TagA/CpsF family glycosyltransferase [candidate division CSSED10-310 bacterium]